MMKAAKTSNESGGGKALDRKSILPLCVIDHLPDIVFYLILGVI